jgi:hypothetical protein
MEGRYFMTHDPSPSARRTRALPARPSLEHLKNEAKQRLKSLRRQNPQARLAAVQLTLAREYGFASWRQLKAHVDHGDPAQSDRKRVFDAAHAGDVETVRRAFAAGFDPGTTDVDGRTIHQIAKADRHEAIEILGGARGRAARPVLRRWSRRSAPFSTPPIRAASKSFADCSTLTPT